MLSVATQEAMFRATGGVDITRPADSQATAGHLDRLPVNLVGPDAAVASSTLTLVFPAGKFSPEADVDDVLQVGTQCYRLTSPVPDDADGGLLRFEVQKVACP